MTTMPATHDPDSTQKIAIGPPARRPLPSGVVIEAAGATHVGLERERNEDNFFVATLERKLAIHHTSVSAAEGVPMPTGVEGTFLVVADGMGGHERGDVASATAIFAVVDHLVNAIPGFDRHPRKSSQRLSGVRDGLSAAIRSGDDAVSSAAGNGGGKRMGTTLTMAYLRFPLMYVAHVGDSRAYLVRGQTIHQLTRDHTIGERLREEAREAGLDVVDQEAETQFDHVLWNALGASEEVTVEVKRCVMQAGDIVVLCSDGLTAHVRDEQIASMASSTDTAERACEALIDIANANGGRDNITVAIARCGAAICT